MRNYEPKPGDWVWIDDNGWGRAEEVEVMSVKARGVYVERRDGAVALFGHDEIKPAEED